MTRPLDFGVVVLPKTVSKCFIAAAFPASAAPHNRSHGGGASGGRGTLEHAVAKKSTKHIWFRRANKSMFRRGKVLSK